jgi:hypothetical protein
MKWMNLGLGLVLSLGTGSGFAVGGGMDSGGGDPYVMDFQKTALVLAKLLYSHKVSHLNPETLVEDVLKEKTKLLSQEEVSVGGDPKCASFDRKARQITISRACWRKLDGGLKMATVCHEFRNIFGGHDYGDSAECHALPRDLVDKSLSPESSISTRTIEGKAAEELAKYHKEGAPFSCEPHEYSNPNDNTMIKTMYCKFYGDIAEAKLVGWWPDQWVGYTSVGVTGALSRYLLAQNVGRTGPGLPEMPKYFRCSANAWDRSEGTCWFVMMPL